MTCAGRWRPRSNTFAGYHADCRTRGAPRALARLGHTQGHQIAGGYPWRWFDGSGDSYGWAPAGCRADAPLVADAMTKRLRGGRQLVFAGDSLAGQSFVSLLCLLMHRLRNESASVALTQQRDRPALKPTSASFALDGGGVVQFVLSDFLTGGSDMAQALDAAYSTNASGADAGADASGAPASPLSVLEHDVEYRLSRSHGGGGVKTARSDQVCARGSKLEPRGSSLDYHS